MKRASPAASGVVQGERLGELGRSVRFDAGSGRELWRLPREDERVARRLLALGEACAGGFVDGGLDAEGAWVLRRAPGPLLGAELRARPGPWPWREAVAVAFAIARALSACERASLSAGRLAPDAVFLSSEGAELRLEGLVAALVGAPGSGELRGSGGSALWTPPAQADGAEWDAAANRYVLGLILYRMLGGEHPHAGAGLRHALAEAARREAPPFAEEVARELPPGLQSLALRALDPEPERRPRSATELGEALAAFVEGRSEGRERPRRAGATGARRASVPSAASRGARRLTEPDSDAGDSERRPATKAAAAAAPRPAFAPALRYAPLALGAVIAALALAAIEPAPAPPRAAPTVREERPLGKDETAAHDCAGCHARQASEWRRSVMAHSVKSPLFNALESLIEEQVGRDFDCPNGAGILRRSGGATACRDRLSGREVTGSGGAHWCVNCHSPADNLGTTMPAWEGRAGGDPRSRLPVRDLLGERALEGISCGFCHQVHGPVGRRGSGGYEGNPTWTSFITGAVFAARPEDRVGVLGIGNSGYDLRKEELLLPAVARALAAAPSAGPDPGVHARPSKAARDYLRSSEFCGSCHDVRLFGTDVLGAKVGEHFKRLRNAYSEWDAWAKSETRAGRAASTCQDCHMSEYPGVCEAIEGGRDVEEGANGGGRGCPPGTRFVARRPGSYPKGRVATSSPALTPVRPHYFSAVDLPLAQDLPDALVDEATLDGAGIPLGARQRRDMLLAATFRFELGEARSRGGSLEIPVVIENVGAGHRVPAGFSQEREFWVHLVVRDGQGRTLYEVGNVDRADEDLRDKIFSRVSTNPDLLDAQGRPEGLFGADVRDGPDVPRWSPPPERGGTSFRGLGLVNFQNGFLRCVRCIGEIAADGRCLPGPSQGVFRADRFADGAYDLDTGACSSNLSGHDALFETYFPIGALDARRGLVKGPDAIIDTRSLPPNVPLRYTYELPTSGRRGPFNAEARLLFRAFPPFLIKAFAAYEREQARRGKRPSGPLVTEAMLGRLEVVELARVAAEVR